MIAADSEGAESPMRGRQRKSQMRADPVFLQNPVQARESGLVVDVGNDEGFLPVVNPSNGGTFGRKLAESSGWLSGRFTYMQPHQLACFVVQKYAEEYEIHHRPKFVGQAPEQVLDIVVRRNCARHATQGLIARPGKRRTSIRLESGMHRC